MQFLAVGQNRNSLCVGHRRVFPSELCWGAILLLFLALLSPAAAQSSMVIYDEALQNSWADWSYGVSRNFGSTVSVHSGSKSIAVTLTNAWGALSLHHTAIDTTPYGNLSFWLNGGPGGGQQLQVGIELGRGRQADQKKLAARRVGHRIGDAD